MNARTCIGCRRAVDRRELVRLVWDDAAGAVVLDAHRTRPGRGAWLHPQPRCLDNLLRRRALARALRRPLSAEQVDAGLADLERRATALGIV